MRSASPWFMSLKAAAGAVSRAIMESLEPLPRNTVMMNPPPMPMDCEFITVFQYIMAMAESMALPPISMTSLWLT